MGQYGLVKKTSLLAYNQGESEGSTRWSRSLMEDWGKHYGKGQDSRSRFKKDRAFAERILSFVLSLPTPSASPKFASPLEKSFNTVSTGVER